MSKPNEPEDPPANIAVRQCGGVRMAQSISGLKRIEPDSQRFVDSAKAKKRKTQQRPAVNLRVLAEHVRGCFIAGGGIQID